MNTVKINSTTRDLTVYNACNYFTRLRGLIGRKLDDVDGLLLTPCNQIHTFFMSFPIDVIYLDKKGSILKIDKNVPKGRVLKKVNGAYRILEIKANHSQKFNLTENLILEVQ